MLNYKKKMKKERGQSIVELAVIFPVMILLFAGIFDFGLYFITAHEVQSAAREGVRHAIALNNLVVNDTRVTDRVNLMLPDSGLLSGAGVTSTVPDCDADGDVTVTVTGTYNFTFLNILGLNTLGVNVPTSMRHESCGSGIIIGGGGGGGGGGGAGIGGSDSICFELTTAHTGSGEDPVFSPEGSPECVYGYFLEGAVVDLTADPDTYWEVDSWTDTDDDGSRSNDNQLTMPASNAEVSVNYVLVPCYTLSLSKNGNGAIPTAPPTDAPHCVGPGEYVSGESIDLTANPDSGYVVSGWSGTEDNGSLSDTNSLTMPANNHSASVTYIEQICYTLTTSHTGNGNNPTPGGSNCTGGKYIENTVVNLNAQPNAGWDVSGWTNTNNDGSTSTHNSVTMSSDKVVSVTYVEETEIPPP